MSCADNTCKNNSCNLDLSLRPEFSLTQTPQRIHGSRNNSTQKSGFQEKKEEL